MELKYTSIARQWLGKHASAAVGVPATIENPWEVGFFVRCVLRLHNKDQQDELVARSEL